jgi:hypothetical protein
MDHVKNEDNMLRRYAFWIAGVSATILAVEFLIMGVMELKVTTVILGGAVVVLFILNPPPSIGK